MYVCIRKFLLLLLIPLSLQAALKKDQQTAIHRYLDCQFCGIMSLPEKDRVPQLAILADALDLYVKKHDTELFSALKMSPVTGFIYYGICEVVDDNDIPAVIPMVRQKLTELSCYAQCKSKAGNPYYQWQYK
jgi:hypothetical protein